MHNYYGFEEMVSKLAAMLCKRKLTTSSTMLLQSFTEYIIYLEWVSMTTIKYIE